MTIELLSEYDIPGALRLSTQAGWNQVEADWRRLITLWPQTCFAGRLNGQLVATSTLATYGKDLGWIGMILVDEAHRGQGNGGAILDAAIRAANDHGIKTIGLDATDLGRPVYLKRGFRDVAGIDRWMRFNSPGEIVGRALPAIASFGGQCPPYMLAFRLEDVRSPTHLLPLDFHATNINRSALLDLLSREPGVTCGAIDREGRVTGFALSRPGRTARHIGPVIAETPADAVAAIKQVLFALTENPEQSLLIDVPRGQLVDWLNSSGFTVARRLTRMCLGADAPCLLGPRIFAASGFELG